MPPRPTIRLTPPVPPGTPAVAFQQSVSVPFVLCDVAGASGGLLIAVLCAWDADPNCPFRTPDGLSPQASDWALIGLPMDGPDGVAATLNRISERGLVTTTAGDPPAIAINFEELSAAATAAHKQRNADAAAAGTSTDTPERIEAERLCRLLADLVAANGRPRPNITETWVNDMEKITRLDNVAPANIEKAIFWCQGDSFWAPNIMSPGKLREKFPRLKEQAARDTAKAAATIAAGKRLLDRNAPAAGQTGRDPFSGPGSSGASGTDVVSSWKTAMGDHVHQPGSPEQPEREDRS